MTLLDNVTIEMSKVPLHTYFYDEINVILHIFVIQTKSEPWKYIALEPVVYLYL